MSSIHCFIADKKASVQQAVWRNWGVKW